MSHFPGYLVVNLEYTPMEFYKHLELYLQYLPPILLQPEELVLGMLVAGVGMEK
jgi:hypothetical protein